MGLDDATCTYGLFHALGLYYSFSSSNLHTFEQNKTDNIMDYSDVSDKPIPVVATWQFQWDILHKKLLTAAQLKKEEERRKNRQTTN